MSSIGQQLLQFTAVRASRQVFEENLLQEPVDNGGQLGATPAVGDKSDVVSSHWWWLSGLASGDFLHRPPFWWRDLFPEAGSNMTSPADGDEGLSFFRAAAPLEWGILGVSCVLMCGVEFAIQRYKPPKSFRSSIAVLCFWVALGLAYNAQIAIRSGASKGWSWFAGYLLEWMLSLDNLFVFHLIFKTYQTPVEQMHKAVFFGIVGAIVMRMCFFMMVSGAMLVFNWVRYLLGGLLIWSGIQAAKDEEDMDVENTWVIRALRACLGSRLTGRYDEGSRLFVTDMESGRVQATMLFVVVVCINVTDVIFAIDSVSAKVAQIPDQYIAFSSSVLAMFGLRAMFFVVSELVEMFSLLKYGLCGILVFIGVELVFSRQLNLPPSTMCLVVAVVFAVCIIGSTCRSK